MGQQKVEYTEISRAEVTKRRNVVISECSRGGYTIAQQITVEEGDSTTSLFMKGAIHVDDVDGLKRLRDALTVCIDHVEAEKAAEAWD
jgi:hypothetical protein